MNGQEIKAIEATVTKVMDVHVSYIRTDIARLESKMDTIQQTGSTLAIANKARLNGIDAQSRRSATIISACVSGVIGAVVILFSWLHKGH